MIPCNNVGILLADFWANVDKWRRPDVILLTVDSIDSKCDNLMECLSELDAYGDIFNNLQWLSFIGFTLPVTSCEAERSFSVQLRTKTYLRSTMGGKRLSGLALVNIYPEVELDIDILTKNIVQMYNRRIKLF